MDIKKSFVGDFHTLYTKLPTKTKSKSIGTMRQFIGFICITGLTVNDDVEGINL